MTATEKASVLTEALPYLQRFRGKTFLIKKGGSAMDNPDLVREVMRDIVFLEVSGIKPVIVHGGGKAISAAMIEAGLEAKFIGGFRVTTPEAIEIVEETLHGEINQGLVRTLTDFGAKATSVHGTSVFFADQLMGIDDDGESNSEHGSSVMEPILMVTQELGRRVISSRNKLLTTKL